MKRRLTIARALINRARPAAARRAHHRPRPTGAPPLWERFYQLKRQGVTIVLTTHYMEEAEQLCDRLVIMDGGRIVAEGSPRELVAQHATREVVELRFATPRCATRAAAARRVRRARRGAHRPCARVHRRRGQGRRGSSTDGELHPESVTNGGARSRTSSSSSPAARWRTDVATPLRVPRSSRRSGSSGGGSGRRRCSRRRRLRRCSSWPRWGSGSATW